MKPMKMANPMSGAVKRFMQTQMTQDEDGPIYEVTVDGEGAPGMDPHMEMGPPAVPDEGPAEYDALSAAAKAVFERLRDSGEEATSIDLMGEGLSKQDAQRVLELLAVEADSEE